MFQGSGPPSPTEMINNDSGGVWDSQDHGGNVELCRGEMKLLSETGELCDTCKRQHEREKPSAYWAPTSQPVSLEGNANRC